jgi:hypothetical protein
VGLYLNAHLLYTHGLNKVRKDGEGLETNTAFSTVSLRIILNLLKYFYGFMTGSEGVVMSVSETITISRLERKGNLNIKTMYRTNG